MIKEHHTIRKLNTEPTHTRKDLANLLSENFCQLMNCRIKNAYRIHLKLKNHQLLEPWETELLYNINKNINLYNQGKEDAKKMPYIDNFNGFLSSTNFLCVYNTNTNFTHILRMPLQRKIKSTYRLQKLEN